TDERNGPNPRAAIAYRHLPWHEVGVMLHVRDQDLVAGPEGASDRFGDDRDRVGGAPREHDLFASAGADEPLHAIARNLVQLRCLLTQRVDRAMHVGVRRLVVARHRLDDAAGLLTRRRGIEVDERPPVDHPLEDRKITSRLFVERHANALASTLIGNVTQRIRVGRTSACSTPRTSAAPRATASARERPWTSSDRTSAEAVQIAQESPANRAALTRPPSSVSCMRTRSPQSGLTSSAIAVAPGSSPRNR